MLYFNNSYNHYLKGVKKIQQNSEQILQIYYNYCVEDENLEVITVLYLFLMKQNLKIE